MRRALRWSLLLLAGACKPAQHVQQPPPPAPAVRPAWVDGRPVTGAYYVGIGIAPKNRPDFQEAAKQNALNDLASEISVTVEGNSLLYTLDTRGQFTDSYTSTVRTRTSQQLEGFELVDSWDSGTELWTYYRLSKAEHARLLAEKKRAAVAQAIDLHTRSRAALDAGDLPGAFDQELRALIALRDHWGEADRTEIDGRSVVLANELHAGLQGLTAGLTLGSLPERCVLEPANGHRRELLIRARHGTSGVLRDMAQVPLSASYPGSAGKVSVAKRTDADGHARITVEGVSLEAPAPELLVRLDLDALVNGAGDPAIVRTLTASLSVPELHVPIDLRMPRVFLRAREQFRRLGAGQRRRGPRPARRARPPRLPLRGPRGRERPGDRAGRRHPRGRHHQRLLHRLPRHHPHLHGPPHRRTGAPDRPPGHEGRATGLRQGRPGGLQEGRPGPAQGACARFDQRHLVGTTGIPEVWHAVRKIATQRHEPRRRP
ncbi:MAG: LPP20 family lipoprotein [Flavobacteriales bacterium]|nr:LPP20 family lipoprotein [Flavobacteriales bacterium]